MKPVIGVALRSNEDSNGKPFLYLYDKVRRALLKMNARIMLIVPTQDINYYHTKGNELPPLTDKEKDDVDFYLDQIDGLFLPGGGKFCEYDRYLLERAIAKNIPILGVCMGMQIMSCIEEEVILEENEDNSHETSDDDIKYKHKVSISKDSRLYSILGKEEILVNSYHKRHVLENHIYKTVGYSEDGLIEAIEYPGTIFNIGVQWHPEYMIDYDEDAKKIMQAFIDSAKEKRFNNTKKLEEIK